MYRIIICACIITLTILEGCSYLHNAEQTAYGEFKPSELLRKYEWFKDASAELDKKQADIKVYNGNVVALKADYDGVAPKDWSDNDRQQLHQWRTEVAGITASYNGLAAEYNSQMAKFNWQFCNVGDLPKGAIEPLPRKYKPYRED